MIPVGIKKAIFIAICSIGIDSLAHAMSAGEILTGSDRARGGGVPGIVWTIRATSNEERAGESRTMEVQATVENALVETLTPLKLKGQKILMVGRNMWFSQPGLRKPVPISPRQKLMGEAAYGDIASTDYAGDYEATLTGEENILGEDCYVLDLRGKNKWVTYDRIVYWVSKSRLLGVKADFYTVSGKRFKTAVFEYDNRISYKGEEIPFLSKMIIRDALHSQNETTLEYISIKVKQIPAAIFRPERLNS